MINIDITLLIQLINFLITLFIINYLIIRPIRGVIAARSAANDAVKVKAESLQGEVGKKLEGYSARIAETQVQVRTLREKIREDARSEAANLLNTANSNARTFRKEASDQLRAESTAVRASLDSRIKDYAQMALKNMLA